MSDNPQGTVGLTLLAKHTCTIKPLSHIASCKIVASRMYNLVKEDATF